MFPVAQVGGEPWGTAAPLGSTPTSANGDKPGHDSGEVALYAWGAARTRVDQFRKIAFGNIACTPFVPSTISVTCRSMAALSSM
jgi:hypothetical protein